MATTLTPLPSRLVHLPRLLSGANERLVVLARPTRLPPSQTPSSIQLLRHGSCPIKARVVSRHITSHYYFGETKSHIFSFHIPGFYIRDCQIHVRLTSRS